MSVAETSIEFQTPEIVLPEDVVNQLMLRLQSLEPLPFPPPAANNRNKVKGPGSQRLTEGYNNLRNTAVTGKIQCRPVLIVEFLSTTNYDGDKSAGVLEIILFIGPGQDVSEIFKKVYRKILDERSESLGRCRQPGKTLLTMYTNLPKGIKPFEKMITESESMTVTDWKSTTQELFKEQITSMVAKDPIAVKEALNRAKSVSTKDTISQESQEKGDQTTTSNLTDSAVLSSLNDPTAGKDVNPTLSSV